MKWIYRLFTFAILGVALGLRHAPSFFLGLVAGALDLAGSRLGLGHRLQRTVAIPPPEER